MEEENNEIRRVSRHSHAEKKSGNLKKIIIGLIGIIIILVISAVVWYNASLSGTGTAEEKVNIEIAMGSGTAKIAKVLKENDLIKSEEVFKLYAKFKNISSFQAGKYSLAKNMTVPEIAEALQTGKVFKDTDINITFIEGKSMTYIAEQIANNTKNTEEDVYALLKDEDYLNELIDEYWFISDEIKNEDIYYPLEGYLFPNTYSFDEDATVKDIFKKMLDQMEKVLDEYKAEIQKSKYTAHEILSIASVIENEGLFDKDKRNISSVIYNRLKKGMSLGCDATTYYAFKIELGSRELYKSEINKYNAYNTRGPNMAGKIPVGPICMISKVSLDAAIHPETTDYLFYVTDKDGIAYFTKTNAEHQAKINELKSAGAWAQF